ncbi:MAG TPA: saccharopine dehydrogenase NADP-binding domain-containing protein, partial [Burkholderiaceae bacterium]|nr:saccharopine dehydrogenase NADP-binding domain-containing protein [Burkholderiaceae bacterium]
MKMLILGGYGNFGTRIARALAATPGISLLIGGRDGRRAQALAQEMGKNAHGVCIDWVSPSFSRTLQSLGVDVLIHAAGPFQNQDYSVAKAAAQAGAHYIDLADARRFVVDFPQAMDAAFQAAGRTAITGASTVPALSSAVVAHLAQDWQRIDTIDICIAPAHTAPRGTATMAAVLDYCGVPIQVWCEGQWQQQHGWAQPQWVHFARMRPRLGALCDIPDLELFPKQFGATQRVMFRAALEVRTGQQVFAGLAALRKAGVLRQPKRLARPLDAVAHLLDPWGSELGGMVV